MSVVTLHIPIQPVTKGRPRFKNGHVHTPSKTAKYEQEIKSIALSQGVTVLDGALDVRILFITKRPKSIPKKRPYRMPNVVTPDVDNLTKAVLDGLEGVAYKNDKQIASLHSVKLVAGLDESPSVTIEIRKLDQGHVERLSRSFRSENGTINDAQGEGRARTHESHDSQCVGCQNKTSITTSLSETKKLSRAERRRINVETHRLKNEARDREASIRREARRNESAEFLRVKRLVEKRRARDEKLDPERACQLTEVERRALFKSLSQHDRIILRGRIAEYQAKEGMKSSNWMVRGSVDPWKRLRDGNNDD